MSDLASTLVWFLVIFGGVGVLFAWAILSSRKSTAALLVTISEIETWAGKRGYRFTKDEGRMRELRDRVSPNYFSARDSIHYWECRGDGSGKGATRWILRHRPKVTSVKVDVPWSPYLDWRASDLATKDFAFVLGGRPILTEARETRGGAMDVLVIRHYGYQDCTFRSAPSRDEVRIGLLLAEGRDVPLDNEAVKARWGLRANDTKLAHKAFDGSVQALLERLPAATPGEFMHGSRDDYSWMELGPGGLRIRLFFDELTPELAEIVAGLGEAIASKIARD